MKTPLTAYETKLLLIVVGAILVAFFTGFAIGRQLTQPSPTFTTAHQGPLILRQNARTGETWYLDAGNRWHKINEEHSSTNQ